MTAAAPAPAPAAVALQARGLVKTFRRGSETVTALRDVDLTVPAGRVVGISGPSGSGKSTLLAVLCGWERPDAGSVAVAAAGRGGPAALPTDALARLPWSTLALVPQTLGLLDDLPARENVLLPARLARCERAEAARADELMQRLGVGHLAARYADEVSLGEQQRIAFVRALLLRPALLLADEPTAHQDAGWGDVVLDLLREHADAGGACVLVSHHRQALDRADEVLGMTDGVLS